MTKTTFSQLDGENKVSAISHMFTFSKSHNWPQNHGWSKEEDIAMDVEQGYNPDDHFSFYLDENNEVETKIG